MCFGLYSCTAKRRFTCVMLLLMFVLVGRLSAQTPTLAKDITVAAETVSPVVSIVATQPDATADVDALQDKVNKLKEQLAEAEATLSEKAESVKQPTLAPPVMLVSIVERKPTPVLNVLRGINAILPHPLDTGGSYAVSSLHTSNHVMYVRDYRYRYYSQSRWRR